MMQPRAPRTLGLFSARARMFSGAWLVFALAACARLPAIRIVGADGAPRAIVRVEVADSEEKRELGLMYRKQLTADQGMLFVFTEPKQQGFWMKNTAIPLDMIFVGPDRGIV